MLVLSLFGEDLFDDWFNFPALKRADQTDRKLHGHRARMLMKIGVYEKEDSYELDIDLPGSRKDELAVELNNGYLTISTAKGLNEEEKDQNGKLIWQERYSGPIQRSFYVGTHVREEDTKAGLKQGVLELSTPKETEAELPEKKTALIGE